MTTDDPAATGAAPGTAKLVLNLGCGAPGPSRLHQHFPPPEWRELRLDIDPAVAPDIVAPLTDLTVLPDRSFDAAWSSHSLEHLYRHEVPVVLAEIFRVLKPGGVLAVFVPDLQSVAAAILEAKLDDGLYQSPMGPITGLDMLYGHGASIEAGHISMAHRTGFTAELLGRRLSEAGFQPVAVRREPDFEVVAVGYRPADKPAIR